MAEEDPNTSAAADAKVEEPSTGEPREVREPDNERWWENPSGGGEVH